MMPDQQRADKVPPWAVKLAQSFLTAPTWTQWRQLYDEHPEVLGPEVDAALASLLRQLELEGDKSGQEAVLRIRALIAACRDVGPELGFNKAQMQYVNEQLAAAPPSSPVRIDMLETISQLWVGRFGITQAEADLDHAVDAARQVVAASTGLATEARQLDILSGYVRQRFLHFHEWQDCIEMVELQRTAVQRGRDAPQRDRCLLHMHLATRITMYIDVTRQIHVMDEETARALLAEAVDAARACLDLAEPISADRLDGLQALIEALRMRYRGFGSLEDLNAAFDGYEELISLSSPGSPSGMSSRRNLARSLHERSVRTHSRDDLQRAALTLSGWLAATPIGEAGRAEAAAELERWQEQLGANQR